MAKQVFVVEEQKDRSGWWIILAAGAMIAFYKWIMLALIFAAIIWTSWKIFQHYQEHKVEKASYNAALVARADRQNQLAMAGDPLGMEGDFPAYTMPMTREEMTIH